MVGYVVKLVEWIIIIGFKINFVNNGRLDKGIIIIEFF